MARIDEGFGIVARVRREERRRRVMRMVGRVLAGVTIAGMVAVTAWGGRWWRQRRGTPVAIPAFPTTSTEIDLLKVHRELLPAWIASEFAAGMTQERRAEPQLWAEHHLRALRSAVASDSELTAIV